MGASPQAIESVLAVFIGQYRRRHPGIDVHLVEEGGLRLADRLERGDVHLALVVSDERFRRQTLFPVHVLAVLPGKHRLSRRPTIEIAELADEPVLLLNRSFASREWFEAACAIVRIRPPTLVESMSPHTTIALAKAGHGIAIVPSTVSIPRGIRAVPLVRRGAALGNWMTAAWIRSDFWRRTPNNSSRSSTDFLSTCPSRPRIHPPRAVAANPGARRKRK